MAKHKWEYIFLNAYRCNVCEKSVIIGEGSSKDDERNKRLAQEECPGEKMKVN